MHGYIESGDDKLLKLLFALAKEYVEDDDSFEFTEDELKALEQRRDDRISGKSKTYSWDDAKKAILGSGKIAL